MHPKIIALVGMCGAGKSVIADFLEKKGYNGIYFGKITIEQLEKRGIELTPDNERLIREELRQKHGMGAYAILSLNKITTLLKQNKNVYIDGLYSWDEYKILKENYPENLIMIEVYADKNRRYRRLAERDYRALNPEQAEERDLAEIENLDKGGPIAFADYKCENNSTRIEAEKKMAATFTKIEHEY